MTDLISKEAAIELAMQYCPDDDGTCSKADKDIRNLLDELENLPSAQPDIIRCGDCKWYGRADKRRFYRGMDCLQKRIDTIVPDKDFCSRAERRTDE